MNTIGHDSQPRLAGRRIIITGAASGIGREIARQARREGASLGLFDRDEAMLREAAEELGGVSDSVAVGVGDLLDPTAPDRVIGDLTSRLGGLDGIVCAAGIVKNAPLVEFPLERWNEVIGVNLTGTFLCAQSAARHMLKAAKGGSIVLIASGLAVSGQASGVAYVASKAGVMGVTRSLALELGPAGIRCNNIAPGVVETPMVQGVLPPEFKTAWAGRNPLGRIGQPDDIAPAACFLLSDESRWITGQSLHINGGNVLT